jgi:membrane protein implicated in regulation of membrane protease activity
LEFLDMWLWLILAGVGLLLALTELFIGIDTGLDLVFTGSSLILGGLVTWPFHSWVLTAIIVAVICICYVVIGRRYVHRWTAVKKERTNIDTIIGKRGIVLHNIDRNTSGIVKVGNEQWRAVAEEEIGEGDEIEVTEIKGVTLTVKRTAGGS